MQGYEIRQIFNIGNILIKMLYIVLVVCLVIIIMAGLLYFLNKESTKKDIMEIEDEIQEEGHLMMWSKCDPENNLCRKELECIPTIIDNPRCLDTDQAIYACNGDSRGKWEFDIETRKCEPKNPEDMRAEEFYKTSHSYKF